MATQTVPPDSPPTTAAITPSPAAPFISDTIDENAASFVAVQKTLQRVMYELNADLERAVITIPLDLNIAAQQVLQLSGFGSAIDGNWLIEHHRLILSGSSSAWSELTLRACQNVAALYQIPGPNPNPSAQQTNDPTSPIAAGSGTTTLNNAVNQGPELQ
jgi:hypothetical protein